MDWMARILGLDERFTLNSKIGGGVIMVSLAGKRLADRKGSASESCLTAAMAARERALRHLAGSTDVPVSVRERYGQKLVMYGSTQTHSLGAKVRGYKISLTIGRAASRSAIPSRSRLCQR